jgi:hypothetical protein
MIRKAVYTRFGEVSYTPADFNCFLEDFKGDLGEKKQFLFSSDDWRLTAPENKHEVRDVEIPDWVPVDLQAVYLTEYEKLGKALRAIALYPNRPFYKSLISFVQARGFLTPRQISSVLHPERRNHGQ